MSESRVRRRVEEEARAEKAWALEDYEWDPITCVARKKRMVASGDGTFAADVAFEHQQAFPGSTLSSQLYEPMFADNPKLASLPVLETVDRSDAEPAAVCEVVGCGGSLAGLKRYYVRMRVCEKHLHAQAIVVNGVVSRFCQQCAKFQFVGEFSGSKKSCIATLERHNARHRAKVLARMQELNDGDADSAPAGGRSGKGRAKASNRRKGCSKAAVVAAAVSVSGRAGSASAPVGAGLATERSNSGDSSGVAAIDGAWASSALAVTQAAARCGAVNEVADFCAQVITSQAVLAAAQAPYVHREHSPGAHVLAAEVTGTSNPASPYLPIGVRDGACSAPVELPPRPLVTTGGNGVVSMSERASLPLGGGGPAVVHLRAFSPPQQQQVQLPMELSVSMPSSWQQQQYGVQSALAAVHDQLVMDRPLGTPAGMAQAGGMGPLPTGVYGVGYGGKDAVPGARHHSQYAAGGSACIPGLQSQAGAAAAVVAPVTSTSAGRSDGSVPRPPSPQYTAGSDTSAGKASQWTSSPTLQAVGGGGGGSPGFRYENAFPTETAKSRGSRQSEAEPCGSTGRIAMHSASPACSTDGVSATRVSASGYGDAAAAADSGGGRGNISAPLQVGNVAARITSIMQELCPLVEQYKQEVAHGSAGPSEKAFSGLGAAAEAAAARQMSGTCEAAAAAAGMAAGAGQCAPGQSATCERVGLGSLPPLVDTAMAMMQQASQLAACLQQHNVSGNHPWTITSGGPEARQLVVSGSGLRSEPLLRHQGSGPGLVRGHASSLSPDLPMLSSVPPPPPQQQQWLPHPGGPALAGWRPMASHPGVVVNEAAAQQAACCMPAPQGSGILPATASFAVPHAPASGPGVGPVCPPPPAPATGTPHVTSFSSSWTVTTAMAARNVTPGGYAGEPSPAAASSTAAAGIDGVATGFGISGTGPAGPSQLQLHPNCVSVAGGFGTGPAQAHKSEDSEDEDEMFQQLLTMLHDEAGDAHAPQHQEQEQLFQGIAFTAHHAVGIHQQTVQTMPYGHSPTSPFYWPAARPSQVPPVAGHQPRTQLHASMPPSFSWSAPVSAPMAPHYVEEVNDVDPRELTRVSLKAMNVLPHELPSNLLANLRRWLKEARAEARQATLRPGCLQLVVDVLRPPSAVEMSSALIPANDADQAAADVFRVLGQRLRDTYVQIDRKVLQMRVGERPVVLSWEEAAEDGGLDGAKYPVLKGCSAAAVCAGSHVDLQMKGGHLFQSGIKVYARLRGHDLRAALLPTEDQFTGPGGGGGDGGSIRVSVKVPPASVGLMALEVGVGHLLGDWWPVLVLPPGCEGAAEEVRRLQVDAEAPAEGQGAAAGGGAEASGAARPFRRLITDLASVLDVFAAAAAADAFDAAAATRSSGRSGGNAGGSAALDGGGGGGSGDTATAGTHIPSEGRSPSPNGGSSHVSRSDATGMTAVSAASWSTAGCTDTLMSSNPGSTLGSSLTMASVCTPTGVTAGQPHAQMLAATRAQTAVATAAAGSPVPAAAGAAAPAAGPPVARLPPTPPPPAAMRQALDRASRLLRYVVARGLPHLTALLLTAANRLACTPDVCRRPEFQPQPQLPINRHAPAQAQGGQPGLSAASAPSSPNRVELLAAGGVDLQALLPLAVLSGSGSTVDQLTAFSARVLRSPLRLDLPQGPLGLSALHLAALLPDGGALAHHLLATQPWAAWQWLCLGWTPPLALLESSKNQHCRQRQPQQPQQQGANGSPAAANGASATANGVVAAKREREAGGKEETSDSEEDGEEEEENPRLPSLTPGQLSVLIGNGTTVRWAVSQLTVKLGGGDGAAAALRWGSPAAALVEAVEVWGRTGVALLEALCAQLAQQKLA